MYEQSSNSVPMPMLVVMVLWLCIIFVSFGLFSPGNATVVANLVVCALAVAGAVFLILEMYRPFEGVIRLSSAPLNAAIASLGQ
jgi:membrane-bound ClpP family serine protease